MLITTLTCKDCKQPMRRHMNSDTICATCYYVENNNNSTATPDQMARKIEDTFAALPWNEASRDTAKQIIGILTDYGFTKVDTISDQYEKVVVLSFHDTTHGKHTFIIGQSMNPRGLMFQHFEHIVGEYA